MNVDKNGRKNNDGSLQSNVRDEGVACSNHATPTSRNLKLSRSLAKIIALATIRHGNDTGNDWRINGLGCGSNCHSNVLDRICFLTHITAINAMRYAASTPPAPAGGLVFRASFCTDLADQTLVRERR